MKPIQPNKEQIEALKNGATTLWIPIDKEIYSIHNGLIEFQGGDGASDVETIKEYIEGYCPLQIGQEYYVQEEFCEGLEDGYDHSSPVVIYYKNDNQELEWVDSDWEPCSPPWRDTNEMQPHQSRFKFIPIDTHIKRCQSICSLYYTSLTGSMLLGHNDPDFDFNLWFEHWHNKQYPNQPYENNPFGFLMKIERIQL